MLTLISSGSTNCHVTISTSGFMTTASGSFQQLCTAAELQWMRNTLLSHNISKPIVLEVGSSPESQHLQAYRPRGG